MGDVGVCPYCSPSNLHTSRVLYYASVNDELHRYNVDTRVDERVDSSVGVWYLPSLCGVDMGVQCLFTHERALNSLNDDGTSALITDRVSHYYVTTVIASHRPH